MERHATMKCPLGSMICKLIYSIVPMICCTRRWGDALDLIRDYRWVQAFQRVILPWASTITESRLPHHGSLQHLTLLARFPFIWRWWCTWTTFPNWPHICTGHLAANLGPRWAFSSLGETWEGMCHLLSLIDGASTCYWSTWRPTRPFLVLHSHLGTPRDVFLGN